jgi:hypothetical protein
MTSKKPEWFEITEKGDAYAGIQKVNKKLPIITLVVAGAVILGGSIFANANNEPSAVAETPTASQSVAAATSSAATSQSGSVSAATTSQSGSVPAATTSHSAKLPVPTVTNVPQRGDGDREGREHHERDREHHEGDHEGRDDD